MSVALGSFSNLAPRPSVEDRIKKNRNGGSSAFWTPTPPKQRCPNFAQVQQHTHPKTPHFYGTGSLSPHSRNWAFAGWEHNSTHEAHLCYWYNVLNCALRSFGQSDSEACTYQSVLGGGRNPEMVFFGLTSLLKCGTGYQLSDFGAGSTGNSVYQFFLNPRHLFSKKPEGNRKASATILCSFAHSFPGTHKNTWFGALVHPRVERGDYISQDAPRINAGTLFPRIPWASILPEIFLRGLGTPGPRWRRERAVSIRLALAWKVFVEPRPGNRSVTLSGSRSNDLPENPKPSETWAWAALLRSAIGGWGPRSVKSYILVRPRTFFVCKFLLYLLAALGLRRFPWTLLAAARNAPV